MKLTIRLIVPESLPQLTTHSLSHTHTHTHRHTQTKHMTSESPVVPDMLMTAAPPIHQHWPSDEVRNMKTSAQATSDKSGDTCGLNSVAILDAFDSRHQPDIWQHPGSGLGGGDGGKARWRRYSNGFLRQQHLISFPFSILQPPAPRSNAEKNASFLSRPIQAIFQLPHIASLPPPPLRLTPLHNAIPWSKKTPN